MRVSAIKEALFEEIKEALRGAIIADVLKTSLDEYKSNYLRDNGKELSSEDEEKFFSKSYIMRAAQNEADKIINSLIDKLIQEILSYHKASWGSFWLKLLLTSFCSVPCICYTFIYARACDKYIDTGKNILIGVTMTEVITAYISATFLLLFLVIACVYDYISHVNNSI
ncbi:MAG: hypothetical protein IJT22_06115 [Synergistaceae bacterium]|nr:hypothetical protein [Synergistaceae bacterium]